MDEPGQGLQIAPFGIIIARLTLGLGPALQIIMVAIHLTDELLDRRGIDTAARPGEREVILDQRIGRFHMLQDIRLGREFIITHD